MGTHGSSRGHPISVAYTHQRTKTYQKKAPDFMHQVLEVWCNCRQNVVLGTRKLLGLNSPSCAFLPRPPWTHILGSAWDGKGPPEALIWPDFSQHSHSPSFQSITMKGHSIIKCQILDQIELLVLRHYNLVCFNVESQLLVSTCCDIPAWLGAAYQLLGEQQGNHPVETNL